MLRASLLASALCAASAMGQTYWFSFGDSYTQTWFDPAGALPSAANPIGNPPFPGWTAAGGENWLTYLTAHLNTSLVLTYNYAYGGATTDAALVAPYEASVLSFVDQVGEFATGAGQRPPETPWEGARALFSVWIGVNDIGNSYYLDGDRGEFSDTLLARDYEMVEKLYESGARNFLFLNVPAIERSPLMLAQDESARTLEAAVIAAHNEKLAARVAAFAAEHEGVTTWVWDAYAVFSEVLDDLEGFGFNGNASGYGEGYFWGNDYHPGEGANKIFAERIADLLDGAIL
ncbi:SGNH hydrolase-type esterase domain-containing protein [Schizophyllum fasciatum]